MNTLINNIRQLVAVPPGPVSGEAFSSPPVIENAAVVLEDDRIAWFGQAEETPGGSYDATVDADGGTVVPGLVDCHTHVVFAGSRENEYVQRIGGATYLDIMHAGGGIRSSMQALRRATIDDLVRCAAPRLRRMLASGTTTVEAKTGYGLTPDDEFKTLLAIKRLAAESPIDIVGTFLGAHTIPPEYDGRSDEYIRAITDEMLLSRVRADGLAEFADVFCERGAFNVEQSRHYLSKCVRHGLKPKIHSEQITNSGGTRLAIELEAVSADHLECIDDETITAMTGSKTIPVLLPGCSFFLDTPPAPARKLIAAGLPVALATDCNPGSCMIESLPLIMSIAASLLKMTPMESLVACTANAAAAIARAGSIGAIAPGYLADLLILDVPNVNRWAYQVGVNAVRTVIKRGRVVLENWENQAL
ncbi:MAG TPA: imidazolonepropionase [Phycisphaerae bacterium]|nr:imidazolonepropionase [Phycisphaerae bacterium]